MLSLHEMPTAARAPVLRTLTTVARRAMIMDFAAPMPWNTAGIRNRAAELAAGPSHFAAFCDYQRGGGLEPLIDSGDLRVEDDHRIDSGTLHVTIVRAPS